MRSDFRATRLESLPRSGSARGWNSIVIRVKPRAISGCPAASGTLLLHGRYGVYETFFQPLRDDYVDRGRSAADLRDRRADRSGLGGHRADVRLFGHVAA